MHILSLAGGITLASLLLLLATAGPVTAKPEIQLPEGSTPCLRIGTNPPGVGVDPEGCKPNAYAEQGLPLLEAPCNPVC